MGQSFSPGGKLEAFKFFPIAYYWEKVPVWYGYAAQQQMVVKWAGLSLLITLVHCHGVPDIQLKMPSIKKKKRS